MVVRKSKNNRLFVYLFCGFKQTAMIASQWFMLLTAAHNKHGCNYQYIAAWQINYFLSAAKCYG